MSRDLRSLGLKRSAPHKLAARVSLAEHPVVRAALAATSLPDSVDLAAFEPPVFDQGQTGSCTAHATTAGVATSFSAGGKPLGFVPSMDLLYKATRAYERALATPVGSPLPALRDSGAELADVYTVLGRYGVKAMAEALTSDGRFSDCEVATVNDEPDVSALIASGQKLVVGPYGVDPSTANVSDVLAAAIVAKIPLGTAEFVDTAFEQLQAGQVAGAPNQSDPNGGGHATLLTGYRPNPSGVGRQFKLRNSWGASWCDEGYVWVSPAWLAAVWELHPLACVLGVF